MKKIISMLTVAFMLVLLLGCSAGTDEASQQVLVTPMRTSINPLLDGPDEVTQLIFDGLMSYDEDGRLTGSLARAWEHNTQDHTYTYYLRNWVNWHDGEPFTAEDVAFTLQAMQQLGTTPEGLEKVRSVQTPDDKTLVIQLEDEDERFEEAMTFLVVPKHLLEGKNLRSDAFFTAPVGTGVYKLLSWEQGSSITLTRNWGYFKQVETPTEQLLFYFR